MSDLPVLTGAHVRLRPWRPNDAPTIQAACQDPDIQRWTTVPSPYGPGDAEHFLAHRVPGARARGGAAYAVEDLADGSLVGSMTLLHAERGIGEIGYWIAPWARRRGLGADALDTLAAWAFAHRDVHRLELQIEPDNHGSRALAARAGFAEEGLLRGRLVLRGERRDVLMHGRLAP
ncbi:GNAT family N-acetyltransferase [Actinomycetospora cinnamomea]|uniref:RimJ/RimL family protein N-acetyltransferase n=1 Tax=Actinomycetospora cinnamomea TaxID=663609 RepID=A0A2U1FM77_9PSEU|nr:GNAT family protein [Actinomycetospora cinnamomea]PVZ13305.1 RimJ/RimL family protein N-acetyltransferase [Actinomycetospora cinnamomea]